MRNGTVNAAPIIARLPMSVQGRRDRADGLARCRSTSSPGSSKPSVIDIVVAAGEID